jgi:hypothetical protein
MAITETYVDPSIAGDSGTGTIGDPYGDVQYALNTMTRDGTNGDRINIKAGTDEVLGAGLSLATYGTPTADAPLVFQGYTSAVGDGGIGGISGGGSYKIINEAAIDSVSFIDMHLHSGSAGGSLILLRNNVNVVNCEIDNCTGDGIRLNTGVIVKNCYLHNLANVVGTYGVYAIGGTVDHCVFEDGAIKFDRVIFAQTGMSITHCILSVSTAQQGIYIAGDGAVVINNTIYASSGTGAGIYSAGTSESSIISNNYIEGFSGAGGDAIEIASGSIVTLRQSNRYYNNTSHETDTGGIINDYDNSAVASSALTNPGAGDFSVGTDLKAGAYPTTFKGIATDQFVDIGAVQREEPAGGGGRRPRIRAHGV